jgi:hypothetical protein
MIKIFAIESIKLLMILFLIYWCSFWNRLQKGNEFHASRVN